MKLAVIPARGGSKRIPRKNIRPFCGRPIIAYSIGTAIESALFDRIIVSTDDDEIADAATTFGAEVPFRRPADLSDDMATTIAVVQHTLNWTNDAGLDVSYVCCIYPTAPFMQAGDLRRALDKVQEDGVDYCFPVTEFTSPVQRAIRIRSDRRLDMFDPAQFHVRSQDLEPAYHDAGQFYWGRSRAFLAGHPLFSPRAVALRIPAWRVQDIDTTDDWERAELLYDVLQRRGEL